jgi:alkanesulfonate monooxygenase SsuD/methylene tetrahydromethanopterin reductase-like flavin-dependent oxidoreductase (luciferase family)
VEGRLILGAGVGWAEAEFQALGISFAERGRSTDEALRVMQTLWTQDAPQYSSPYYSFADIIFQPRPVQQPLPLWGGGQSRAACAAQIAADLPELQALGASHVVLSTQTDDMARLRWEIETLAAHVHLRCTKSDYVIWLSRHLLPLRHRRR